MLNNLSAILDKAEADAGKGSEVATVQPITTITTGVDRAEGPKDNKLTGTRGRVGRAPVSGY
jgi:hypothetical protein